MGDLKKNISWSEIACQCGCDMGREVDWDNNPNQSFAIIQLANDIQKLADILSIFYHEARILIKFTSWCRCPTHNASIPGAAKNSIHKTGGAADCKWRRLSFVLDHSAIKIPPILIARTALLLTQAKITNFGGIGCYHNRVHLDIRPGKIITWTKSKSGYQYGVDFTEK